MTNPGRSLWALASQRWLQFLVLGGSLFALSPRSGDHRIDIDSQVLAGLRIDRARKIGVPELDPDQARQLDARAIEDEVLVREARRLGLDADDAIIRARLVQKMLFLAEELDGASLKPTEAELRSWFEEHQADYPVDGRVSFVQIFAKTREGAEALRDRAEAFSASAAADAIPPLGESLPVSRRASLPMRELEHSYGPTFAASVREAPIGAWTGPVESTYGWHLVRILDRKAPHLASFEEVEGQVRLDALIARREVAVSRFLADAFRRYDITVDGQPYTPSAPTHRTAPRTQPSLED